MKDADRVRYKDAKILSMDYEMRMEDEVEPVCMKDEDVRLSEDEKSVLALGPKFCIYNNLSEEKKSPKCKNALRK